MKNFFLILLVLTGLSFGSTAYFKEPQFHQALLDLVGATYNQEYQKAEKILKDKIPSSSPCYKYFKGYIYISIFNDVGDTSKFYQAEKIWEQLKEELENRKSLKKPFPNHQMPAIYYLGLTEVQLSYTSKVKGKMLESALLAKSGIKKLKKYPKYAETQSVLAIYDFYKGLLLKYFDWLPFVDADYVSSMKRLRNIYHHSQYLEAVFLTSLIWMQFDLGSYDSGLKLTQKFLARYPQNRVYQSMEADFLFKLKQNKKAAQQFEALKEKYQNWYEENGESKNLKINYYCAVGNLVRIYHALGDKNKKLENSKVWFSPKVQGIKDWLPKSLLEDLENYR